MGSESRVLVLTRITCRNKCRHQRQHLARKGFSVSLAGNLTVSCIVKNQGLRILQGLV